MGSAAVKISSFNIFNPSWSSNRRLQHSTPANSTSSKTNIPDESGSQGSDSTPRTAGKGTDPTTDGIQVLAIAADEGRRLSKLKCFQVDTSSKVAGPASNIARVDSEIQGIVNAANTLLGVTKTDSLAPIILDRLSVGENTDETDKDNDDVASLHRAFLIVTQSCLNLAAHCRHTDAGSAGSYLLEDNEVLECALALSMRAHELSLPFHLPLYQSLAIAVAESSSIDPLRWIFQLANWTSSSIGPVDSTFFARPLLALCRRKRLEDATNLIHTMNNVYGQKYIDSVTTKEVLFLLKDLVRPIWTKVQSKPSRLEQDAVELVLLLETSIWKVLDYVPLEEERGGDNKCLRDAVEAIMSTEEDAREALSSLEQMLSDTDDTSILDSEDDDYDDDLDDDDYSEKLHSFVPAFSRDNPLRDLMQAVDRKDVGGKMKGNFDVQISRSGNQTILSVLPAPPAEDESEADEDYHSSVIYSRRQQDGYLDMPDLTSALHETNGGVELLYSKEFEKHVYRQLYPKTTDVDYDIEY